MLANFLDPAPEPTLPVVVVLVGADGLARPLGSDVLDFACACALSHPSKSGSPPSSKLTGGAGAGFGSEGASKKSSSAISPHASSISCSSARELEKYFSGGGVGTTSGVEVPVTAWRWMVGIVAEDRDESAPGGTDEDLSLFGGWALATFGCMSSLAVAILLVNDEIAHPAHPAASLCVVPIRGTAPFVEAVAGGGKTVSGSELPYLRIRWR